LYTIFKTIISRLTRGRLWPECHPDIVHMHPKDQLAVKGELLAETELKRAGYSIIAKGWRWHRYELDLIARKGNVVAVVEVKTRRDDSFGSPQEAVPVWKQRRIVTAARAFIRQHGLGDCLIRFDIMAILAPRGQTPQVEHITDAFQAGKG